MVCYAVPLAALLITAFRRKLLRKTDMEGFWLNLLLLGGAVFGMIDHFWNGELFLLGTNLFADLALGATITIGLFGAWGVIVFKDRLAKFSFLNRRTGVYK